MSHFVLRTEDMDAARRVEEFEAACTQICHLQITPAGEEYSSRTSIALVGNAVLADTTHSSCVTQRTPALATATGDNILLHVPLSGGFSIRQRGGGEQDCGPGSIYLDPTEQPGIARFDGLHTNAFYLSLPRAALGPAADKLSLRSQIALTPQWRLMLAYAQAVHKEAALLPPADLDLSAVHLQDLALLAIGADRDAEAIARGRGARVARLRAIKADIERNLTDPGLSPRWISMRHGISPRYLRSLFSDEGTSFTDHVALRRLMLAHRRLSDPAQSGVPVGRIAAEAGFGDLSWFNARFRQRFGLTPSQVRALATGRQV